MSRVLAKAKASASTPAKAIAISITIALLCAPVAFAQNPCEEVATDVEPRLAQHHSGVSDSGYQGGDDSGIGGTGLSGGDESGIGGTGFSGGEDSGIGGTGIYGTITGFGSICVNGLRVHYDDGTPVEVDGRLADRSLLAVGQVVAVDAKGEGLELAAERVSVHSLLVGPITRLDAAAEMIDVMGSSVELSSGDFENASAAGLGARVRIGGLRRSDDVVVSSWLANAIANSPDAISGLVQRDELGRVHIGGIAVGLAPSALEDGAYVRATGRFDAETGTFAAAAASSAPLLSRNAQQLSVEGYVREVSGEGRLFLSGVEVEPGSLERMRAGGDHATRVRVTGRQDVLGRLRVERVQRVERPALAREAARAAARDRAAHGPRVQRPNEKAKHSDTRLAPADRVRRERPERPPKPQPPVRPPKVDRPTAIDTNIRDRLTR